MKVAANNGWRNLRDRWEPVGESADVLSRCTFRLRQPSVGKISVSVERPLADSTVSIYTADGQFEEIKLNTLMTFDFPSFEACAAHFRLVLVKRTAGYVVAAYDPPHATDFLYASAGLPLSSLPVREFLLELKAATFSNSKFYKVDYESIPGLFMTARLCDLPKTVRRLRAPEVTPETWRRFAAYHHFADPELRADLLPLEASIESSGLRDFEDALSDDVEKYGYFKFHRASDVQSLVDAYADFALLDPVFASAVSRRDRADRPFVVVSVSSNRDQLGVMLVAGLEAIFPNSSTVPKVTATCELHVREFADKQPMLVAQPRRYNHKHINPGVRIFFLDRRRQEVDPQPQNKRVMKRIADRHTDSHDFDMFGIPEEYDQPIWVSNDEKFAVFNRKRLAECFQSLNRGDCESVTVLVGVEGHAVAATLTMDTAPTRLIGGKISNVHRVHCAIRDPNYSSFQVIEHDVTQNVEDVYAESLSAARFRMLDESRVLASRAAVDWSIDEVAWWAAENGFDPKAFEHEEITGEVLLGLSETNARLLVGPAAVPKFSAAVLAIDASKAPPPYLHVKRALMRFRRKLRQVAKKYDRGASDADKTALLDQHFYDEDLRLAGPPHEEREHLKRWLDQLSANAYGYFVIRISADYERRIIERFLSPDMLPADMIEDLPMEKDDTPELIAAIARIRELRPDLMLVKNAKGFAALHEAARAGASAELVRAVVGDNPDPAQLLQLSGDSTTPAVEAARLDELGALQSILSFGPPGMLYQLDAGGNNLAHYAARLASDDVLVHLFKEHKDLFRQRNVKGQTPVEVYEASEYKEPTDVFKTLMIAASPPEVPSSPESVGSPSLLQESPDAMPAKRRRSAGTTPPATKAPKLSPTKTNPNAGLAAMSPIQQRFVLPREFRNPKPEYGFMAASAYGSPLGWCDTICALQVECDVNGSDVHAQLLRAASATRCVDVGNGTMMFATADPLGIFICEQFANVEEVQKTVEAKDGKVYRTWGCALDNLIRCLAMRNLRLVMDGDGKSGFFREGSGGGEAWPASPPAKTPVKVLVRAGFVDYC